MTDRLDLPGRWRRELESLLAEHVPDAEVWAYGSRVTGRSHEASDLDLVLRGPDLDRIPSDQLGDLRDALDESNIPIIVQFHDWPRLPPSFHPEIKRQYVVLQGTSGPAGDDWSWSWSGAAPREWISLSLGDACTKIGSGATPRGGERAYTVDGPVRLIRSQNVHNDRFRAEGLAHIDDLQAAKLDNVEVQAGDVLLNITGDSVARSCQVPTDVLPARVNQHVAILRSNPKRLNNSFLRYVLISPGIQKELLSLARSGGTRNALTKRDLASFQIQIPKDIETQTKVASILSTLDDRIELNRRMCETLEAMAQALFKSWFIDFDPVRAKMEGRYTGLPDHIADLFPDRLMDSSLGPIPHGWQSLRLGELADTVRGRSYRSSELAKSDTALVTLKSFARGGGYRPDGLKPYVGKYNREQIVLPGELVLACTDVTQAAEIVGRPAIVSLDLRYSTLVASLDTLIIRPLVASPNLIPFLYHLTSSLSFVHYAYAHVSGTTVLHLSREAIPAFEFPSPPPSLMHAYATLATPLHHRLLKTSTESALLVDLRDVLLPRLLSGKWSVDRMKQSEPTRDVGRGW